MNMFTLRERLIASDAWMLLWMLGSVGWALVALFRSLEPSLAALQSPLFGLLSALALLSTIALTLLIAPFFAVVVLDGMIARQIRRNGGPFSIGDRVVVIPGKHSGRAGVITSFGQCQTLRVTLDGDRSEHGPYSHYQLKKVAEPSAGSQ